MQISTSRDPQTGLPRVAIVIEATDEWIRQLLGARHGTAILQHQGGQLLDVELRIVRVRADAAAPAGLRGAA